MRCPDRAVWTDLRLVNVESPTRLGEIEPLGPNSTAFCLNLSPEPLSIQAGERGIPAEFFEARDLAFFFEPGLVGFNGLNVNF